LFLLSQSATLGQPNPKLRVFPPVDVECILEINRFWSGLAFRLDGRCPFCFFPTLVGNRCHPASSATSRCKNPSEKRHRTVNGKTEKVLRAPCRSTRRRIQS